MKTHYIGMNGSYGCLPDNCFAVSTLRDAVQSLAETLELSRRQVQELRRNRIVECSHSQGADYAEIVECTCNAMEQHK